VLPVHVVLQKCQWSAFSVSVPSLPHFAAPDSPRKVLIELVCHKCAELEPKDYKLSQATGMFRLGRHVKGYPGWPLPVVARGLCGSLACSLS
jgi:hypothetical protein